MNYVKKYFKYLLVFLAGILFTWLAVQLTKKDTRSEASHTIAYGIQRLNKLVVAEQTYANFYSHKSKTSYFGEILSFDKNLLLKVEIKAQASYDLSQMEVSIDSVNQIIHIKKIPEIKIETFPDVEFFDMNQSMLNQFSKEDLNGIKQRAVQEVQATIDQSDLRQQAHQQLIHNLEEIYLLAKIYNWKIQDDTAYAQELKDRIKI
ncbi:MAG: DUF4230 domain-containing protein [Flavobacteriaceae bacterium]|nr:DUF4230 domain-containing protein [Flavobacteriaceae bacterium]